MTYVYPTYYPDFACIASACRHSCCVGWEIDIDGDTYEAYQAVGGEMGERLKRSISEDGVPHFILDKEERCPFLNREGLCDLILSLGEDSLCEICREHPRYYNRLSDCLEVGLGLCCEEAARLILTQKEPLSLVSEGEGSFTEWERECLTARERTMARLQDRAMPIRARMDELSEGVFLSIEDAIAFFLTFEIMDEAWRELLLAFRFPSEDELSAFSRHMTAREHEYENFAVALLFRYAVTADDREELRRKLLFPAFSASLLYQLGAFLYAERGTFTVSDQIELVRLFSSEIEYDEDNLSAFLWRLS